MMQTIRLVMPVIWVLIYTTCIFLAVAFVQKTMLLGELTANKYLNFQANYQWILLIITGCSLLTTFLSERVYFKQFFRWGELAAPTQPMPLFGIKAADGWLKTGISLSITISLATGIFMYLQLQKNTIFDVYFFIGMAWVLVFAASNSFAEEMIFRLGIVVPYAHKLRTSTIYLISAVLFGVPHWAGMPSGAIGALMASVLGYVLAKSMYETRGFFWAWWIHFIQDVLIMTVLFVNNQ